MPRPGATAPAGRFEMEEKQGESELLRDYAKHHIAYGLEAVWGAHPSSRGQDEKVADVSGGGGLGGVL